MDIKHQLFTIKLFKFKFRYLDLTFLFSFVGQILSKNKISHILYSIGAKLLHSFDRQRILVPVDGSEKLWIRNSSLDVFRLVRYRLKSTSQRCSRVNQVFTDSCSPILLYLIAAFIIVNSTCSAILASLPTSSR